MVEIKNAFHVVTIIAFLSGAFLMGRLCGKRTSVEVQRDTIVHYQWKTAEISRDIKTIEIGNIPYPVFISDTVREKIIVKDTLYFEIVRREYKDSCYHVIVSGPKVGDLLPSLDSLTFREKTKCIVQTALPEKNRISFSATSFLSKKVDSFVGFQYSRDGKAWSYSCGAGYDLMSKVPVVTAEVNLCLFKW